MHASPTCDKPFHLLKEGYASHPLARGVDDGLIASEDGALIEAFVAELRTTNGIGTRRTNKNITTALVLWWRLIGPLYSEYPNRSVHRCFAPASGTQQWQTLQAEHDP